MRSGLSGKNPASEILTVTVLAVRLAFLYAWWKSYQLREADTSLEATNVSF